MSKNKKYIPKNTSMLDALEATGLKMSNKNKLGVNDKAKKKDAQQRKQTKKQRRLKKLKKKLASYSNYVKLMYVPKLDPKLKELSPPVKQLYTLGKPELYPSIKFNNKSTLNNKLLNNSKTNKLLDNLTTISRTQVFDGAEGEADIVIGLDFGTSTTKVILMEQGSKHSWAIPFTTGVDNPYLLPSQLYYDGEIFSLNGEKCDFISNLKSPLILNNEATIEQQINIIAFLSLVIRHSREWFLRNAATSFDGFEFEWFFQLDCQLRVAMIHH